MLDRSCRALELFSGFIVSTSVRIRRVYDRRLLIVTQQCLRLMPMLNIYWNRTILAITANNTTY
jgi:hypothetical protein